MTTASDGAGADAAGGGGAGGGAGDAGGAAAAGAGGAGAAAAADAKAFYESFADEGLRTNPSIVQNFKSAEDLAKAYVNLEKRFGIDPNRRIDLPTDPNDVEGMKAVYAKLGMPETPDAYGFKLDDKATEGDKALVATFTKTAHELGLSTKQAQGLMKMMEGQVQADAQAQEAAQAQRLSEGKATLQKEFGTAFEPRMREINNLLKQHADPELVQALGGDNLAAYPNVAKLLGKILDRMAEPGAAGGESGDAAGADRAMTPTQAHAAVRALEADPVKGKALTDKSHPQHAAVVAERSRLLAMKDGRAPA